MPFKKQALLKVKACLLYTSIAAIETDENKWNARYFDRQQGDLNQNFALERLFHLVNVRETLMRKGAVSYTHLDVYKRQCLSRAG